MPPFCRPGITSAVIRQCYKNVKTPAPRLKEKSDLLFFSFESFNSFFFSIEFLLPFKPKKEKIRFKNCDLYFKVRTYFSAYQILDESTQAQQ